jgi:hypothetical protein
MEDRIAHTQLLEYVLKTHMEEADYMFLLEEKIKEYNSAEGTKYEEFLRNGYRRQLWIKSGNTGVFVPISGLESSITCWKVDQEIVYSRVETRQAPIQTDPQPLFSILNENAMWQALLIIILRKHHLIHVTS